MILTFIGTRSSDPPGCEGHLLQSCLMVETDQVRLQIDCGEDHAHRLAQLAPDILLLTHGHDDHAGGLHPDPPCPVWAGEPTRNLLLQRGLTQVGLLHPGQPLVLEDLTVLPFEVEHSLRAPALGFRIEAGSRAVIYLPDVAALGDGDRMLPGADLYIGDGTCFDSSLVRVEQGHPCGHAGIISQLAWSARTGIRQVIFSHCGPEICADPDRAGRTLAGLAARLGLHAAFALDGQTVNLPNRADRARPDSRTGSN